MEQQQITEIKFETAEEVMSRITDLGEPLLGSWLRSGAPVLIAGAAGCGKSIFTSWMGYSLALGVEFLGWKAYRQVRTAIFDGEMRLDTLQRRMGQLHKALGPAEDRFTILGRHSFRSARKSFPDLKQQGDRELILAKAKEVGAEILVFDNVNCLFPDGDENSPQYWQLPQQLIWEAQDRGITPILVHHTVKSNRRSPGGSSRNERVAEVVIVLSPIPKEPGAGASFNISFPKTRELGEDAIDMSAVLYPTDGGFSGRWVTGPYFGEEPGHPKEGEVKKLHGTGMSLRAIAAETGVPKSTVGRLVTRDAST